MRTRGIGREFVLILTLCAISMLAICTAGPLQVALASGPRQTVLSNQFCNLLRPIFVESDTLLARIDSIDNRLQTAEGSSAPSESRIHVLNHPTPNAFSIAPNDIYLTTGLLDLLKNEDELAIVLAREHYFLQEGDRAAAIFASKKGAVDATELFFALCILGIGTYDLMHTLSRLPPEGPSSLDSGGDGVCFIWPYSSRQRPPWVWCTNTPRIN